MNTCGGPLQIQIQIPFEYQDGAILTGGASRPPRSLFAYLYFFPHALQGEESFQHILKSCPSQGMATGGGGNNPELMGPQPRGEGDKKGKSIT